MAELNVNHMQAVTTPCILVCRAKLQNEKGRWIEDGQGTVFAEGRGAFVLGKAGAPANI